MRKFKSILLILLGGLLAIFLYENWIPAPHLKIFGKEIVQVNISLLIVVCLAFGGIFGFLSHVALSRSRKKKAPADLGEEKAPEPQEPAQPQEQGQ
jgi:hypothetical protein